MKFLGLILVVSVLSCSKKEETKVTYGTLTDIAGHTYQYCANVSSNDLDVSMLVSAEISETSLVATLKQFTGSTDCSTGLFREAILDFDYEQGADGLDGLPSGAIAVDNTVKTVHWIARTEDARQEMIDDCEGDILDFPVDTEVEVTGNCGEDTVGTIIYSFLRITTSVSPHLLEFSDSDEEGDFDGSTPEKRERIINSILKLRKQ